MLEKSSVSSVQGNQPVAAQWDLPEDKGVLSKNENQIPANSGRNFDDKPLGSMHISIMPGAVKVNGGNPVPDSSEAPSTSKIQHLEAVSDSSSIVCANIASVSGGVGADILTTPEPCSASEANCPPDSSSGKVNTDILLKTKIVCPEFSFPHYFKPPPARLVVECINRKLDKGYRFSSARLLSQVLFDPMARKNNMLDKYDKMLAQREQLTADRNAIKPGVYGGRKLKKKLGSQLMECLREIKAISSRDDYKQQSLYRMVSSVISSFSGELQSRIREIMTEYSERGKQFIEKSDGKLFEGKVYEKLSSVLDNSGIDLIANVFLKERGEGNSKDEIIKAQFDIVIGVWDKAENIFRIDYIVEAKENGSIIRDIKHKSLILKNERSKPFAMRTGRKLGACEFKAQFNDQMKVIYIEGTKRDLNEILVADISNKYKVKRFHGMDEASLQETILNYEHFTDQETIDIENYFELNVEKLNARIHSADHNGYGEDVFYFRSFSSI